MMARSAALRQTVLEAVKPEWHEVELRDRRFAGEYQIRLRGDCVECERKRYERKEPAPGERPRWIWEPCDPPPDHILLRGILCQLTRRREP